MREIKQLKDISVLLLSLFISPFNRIFNVEMRLKGTNEPSTANGAFDHGTLLLHSWHRTRVMEQYLA